MCKKGVRVVPLLQRGEKLKKKYRGEHQMSLERNKKKTTTLDIINKTEKIIIITNFNFVK